MKAHNAIEWTPKMLAYLRKNFSTQTNNSLAANLGLKITAVRRKCYELDLYKMRMEYWTDEQIQFLTDHYKTIGDTELAEIFNKNWHKEKGWTKKHIEKKRTYLKLVRTEEDKDLIRENHRQNGSYVIGNRKMWNTRGCRQYGEIVIWGGQSYTKVERGYIHTRVFVWNKHFGDIPEGMMVRHKDRNSLNCAPDNLELVTRAQNALLNNWSRYPPELRRSMLLIKRINKHIKKQGYESSKIK